MLTRVFQTVVLAYMIAGFAGMPSLCYTYEFIVVSILCGAFTVVQAYTLLIYRAIDVKLGKKLAAAGHTQDACSRCGGPC